MEIHIRVAWAVIPNADSSEMAMSGHGTERRVYRWVSRWNGVVGNATFNAALDVDVRTFVSSRPRVDFHQYMCPTWFLDVHTRGLGYAVVVKRHQSLWTQPDHPWVNLERCEMRRQVDNNGRLLETYHCKTVIAWTVLDSFDTDVSDSLYRFSIWDKFLVLRKLLLKCFDDVGRQAETCAEGVYLVPKLWRHGAHLFCSLVTVERPHMVVGPPQLLCIVKCYPRGDLEDPIFLSSARVVNDLVTRDIEGTLVFGKCFLEVGSDRGR